MKQKFRFWSMIGRLMTRHLAKFRLRSPCATFLYICWANLAAAWPPGLSSSKSVIAGSSSLPTIRVVSFGDSLASGFDPTFWLRRVPGGTYADRLGELLNQKNNQTVEVRNIAQAGIKSAGILERIKKNAAFLSNADVVLVEGGSDDLLLHESSKIDLCQQGVYDEALANAKINALEIVRDLPTNASVVIFGIYYPSVNVTKARRCKLPPHETGKMHDLFMDVLALANWELYRGSQLRGFLFYDTLSVMNCGPANHPRCRVRNFDNFPDYRASLHRLDKEGIFTDPIVWNYLQRDGLHPTGGTYNLWAKDLYQLLLSRLVDSSFSWF